MGPSVYLFPVGSIFFRTFSVLSFSGTWNKQITYLNKEHLICISRPRDQEPSVSSHEESFDIVANA